MHANCRCTTIMAGFTPATRIARETPETGKNYKVDGNMTFEEWKNSLTPEQKAALELSRKKDANKTADKLQFAEYKNRLGTKVTGRSFDKWQEMKYTDKEKWEDLKGFFRYKGNNPKSTQNDYNCVKELRELGIKGSIHIPAKEIKLTELKFDNKHINEDRNHNVSEAEAKKFIENAVLSITKRNGLTENYYSKNGVSYVNPTEKAIKTAFTEKEFQGDVLTIMEVIKKYGY